MRPDVRPAREALKSEQSNPFISPVPSTELLRREPHVVSRRRLGRRNLCAGSVGDLEDRLPHGETSFVSAEVVPRAARTWHDDLCPTEAHSPGEVEGRAATDHHRFLDGGEVRVGAGAGHENLLVRGCEIDDVGLLARNRRNAARDRREDASRGGVAGVGRARVVVVAHDRRAAAHLVRTHVVGRARAAVVTCHGVRGVHAGARCRVAGI